VSNLLVAAIGVFCGLLMGLLFFGGLWLTVGRLGASRNPLLLVFASFFLRTAAIALCFYGLARLGGWIGVVAALAGLLAMRMILICVLRREPHEKSLAVGDA
jgi:F1F0 ATPase subunit 2